MTTLQQREIILRVEKQREQNRIRQQKYRQAHNTVEFKKEKAEYHRDYQKKIKQEYNEIMGIVNKQEEQPKKIDIKEVIRPPPSNKRTKRYKKKNNVIDDVIPSYIGRKTPLEYTTIHEYISKLNIIHKLIVKSSLDTKLKSELTKLISDNSYDEKYILEKMPYLLEIEDTITKLRAKYPKDNSFKSYLVSITVIIGHIKDLNNQYQIITRVAKHIGEEVQEKRSENILPKTDEKKIIDLEEEVIIKKLDLLTNLEDKSIYALYTLFPSRREDDYRLMKLTYYDKIEDLDENFNYLQIQKNNDMKFIFNQYKTKKRYGQQIYNVPEKITSILHSYINQNALKELDYLFYANNNKKEKRAQSNFSTKIANTFKKVYGIPIPIRFIRKSYSTFLNKIAYENKLSTKIIKEYTDKMAHSDSESKLYRVVGFK